MLESALQVWWQLQVFVLHCELDFDQVIEAIILGKVLIESRTLELLEEEDKDLHETLWVLI